MTAPDLSSVSEWGSSGIEDITTTIPLLQPVCRDLGQHYIVLDHQPLCGCRAIHNQQIEDDDRGDTVRRQTRVRRDRYGRLR
jgi:hypothetical protein